MVFVLIPFFVSSFVSLPLRLYSRLPVSPSPEYVTVALEAVINASYCNIK
jgi:hypothetical protein